MPEEKKTTGYSPSFFIFAIGMTFLMMNVWSCQQAYRLAHFSVPGQATVTRTYLVKHRGSVSFFVDYSLDADGKQYEGSADVTRTMFVTLRPGSPVAIRYVPSNPSLSETADISHTGTTMFLVKFLGFPVSFFILFLAFRKQPQEPMEGLDDLGEGSNGHNIALPNTVKGIAFTMYPVLDMKRARKFYEQDLGLKPEVDFEGKWVEYHLWDNCFALTSMANGVQPNASAGGSIALEVQDVDDFVSQLKKKGIQIKVEPFSTRVCRMAVIIDPEGNALTLHSRNSRN